MAAPPTPLIAGLLLSAALLAACGGSRGLAGGELGARRADLAEVGQALAAAEAPAARELATARPAWAWIDRGLPAQGSAGRQAKGPHGQANGPRSGTRGSARPATTTTAHAAQAVAAAAAQARRLPASLVSQPVSLTLTGPAAGIAGLYELYSGLSEQGWGEIEAALRAPGRQSPAAAAFLRGNVDTYIIAIYDGHFDLSHIGRQMQRAYRRLGGAQAFGRSLTQAQVAGIARAFSPRAVRLRPHPWHALSGH